MFKESQKHNSLRIIRQFLAACLMGFFSSFNLSADELSTFEKRELSRLLEMDWTELAKQPVSGVLGY